MKELIGKTVEMVLVDEDKNGYLVFIIKDGAPVVYAIEGDCCSSSWLEDIIGVENFDGAHVVTAEKKEFSDQDWNEAKGLHADTKPNEWEDDCLQIFGYTLGTDKGNIDIELRNESNGYYSGDLRHLMDRQFRLEKKDDGYEIVYPDFKDSFKIKILSKLIQYKK